MRDKSFEADFVSSCENVKKKRISYWFEVSIWNVEYTSITLSYYPSPIVLYIINAPFCEMRSEFLINSCFNNLFVFFFRELNSTSAEKEIFLFILYRPFKLLQFYIEFFLLTKQTLFFIGIVATLLFDFFVFFSLLLFKSVFVLMNLFSFFCCPIFQRKT